VSFIPWPPYPQGKSPCYPQHSRQGRPHCWSGCSGKDEKLHVTNYFTYLFVSEKTIVCYILLFCTNNLKQTMFCEVNETLFFNDTSSKFHTGVTCIQKSHRSCPRSTCHERFLRLCSRQNSGYLKLYCAVGVQYYMYINIREGECAGNFYTKKLKA